MATIITVHGTGHADPSDSGEHWWQRDSAFHESLSAHIRPKSGGDLEYVQYHWDGANSELSRRDAGRDLYDFLRNNYESRGKSYHLVGHSHGGSVIAEALRQSVYRKSPLKRLASWTTVATPFLQFKKEFFFLSRLNLMGQIFVFFLAIFAAVNTITLFSFCGRWYENQCYAWDGSSFQGETGLAVGLDELYIPVEEVEDIVDVGGAASAELEILSNLDSTDGVVYRHEDHYFLRLPVEYDMTCDNIFGTEDEVYFRSKIVRLRRENMRFYVEPRPADQFVTWIPLPEDDATEVAFKAAYRAKYEDNPDIERLCAPRWGDRFEVLNYFNSGYMVEKDGESFYVYYHEPFHIKEPIHFDLAARFVDTEPQRRVLREANFQELSYKAFIYGAVFVLLLAIAAFPINRSQSRLARRYGGEWADQLAKAYADKWISLWDNHDEAINGIANALKVDGKLAPRNILVGAIKTMVAVILLAGVLITVNEFLAPVINAALIADGRGSESLPAVSLLAGLLQNVGLQGIASQFLERPIILLSVVLSVAFVVSLAFIYILLFLAHHVGLRTASPFVASKFDNFFWRQIRRQSFGNDTLGERERALQVKPPEFDRAWLPLPAELSDKLAHYTHQYATQTIDRIRRSLGLSRDGRQRLEVTEIMNQLSWGELIHTSYFDVEEFVRLISAALIKTGDFAPTEHFDGDDRRQAELWLEEVRPRGARVLASDPKKYNAEFAGQVLLDTPTLARNLRELDKAPPKI